MVPSRSSVENGTDEVVDHNAVATWGLCYSIKISFVGLKIHVQKKCWCKHALQSQWGDSPRFTPISLFRIDMQVLRLALLPREETWPVGQLSDLQRPWLPKGWPGHLP